MRKPKSKIVRVQLVEVLDGNDIVVKKIAVYADGTRKEIKR